MENQPKEGQKLPSGDATATASLSSVKTIVNTKSPASPSKVLIITPEQIAKLGLTQQIKNAVESQVSSKPPEKRRPRVTKLNIIDDVLPTADASKQSVKSEVTCFNNLTSNVAESVQEKKEDFKKPIAEIKTNKKYVNINLKHDKKDDNMRKETSAESFVKSDARKLISTAKQQNKDDTKQIKKEDLITSNIAGVQLKIDKGSLKDTVSKQDEKIIIPTDSKNITIVNEDVKPIQNQSDTDEITAALKKEKPIIEDMKSTNRETTEPLSPLLKNQVISSMKSKLLSILEARSPEKKANVPNISHSPISLSNKKSTCDSEAITKPKICTKKRKQEEHIQPTPMKISKTAASKTIGIDDLLNTSEDKSTKINISPLNETSCEDSVKIVPDSPSNLPIIVTTPAKFAANKNPLKRRRMKARPSLSNIAKATKKSMEHATMSSSYDDDCQEVRLVKEVKENTNSNLSPVTAVPSDVTPLSEPILESRGDTKSQKIHVLSNEQISLPKIYIDQMLKHNFSQKLSIYKSTPNTNISQNSAMVKHDSELQQKVEMEQETKCICDVSPEKKSEECKPTQDTSLSSKICLLTEKLINTDDLVNSKSDQNLGENSQKVSSEDPNKRSGNSPVENSPLVEESDCTESSTDILSNLQSNLINDINLVTSKIEETEKRSGELKDEKSKGSSDLNVYKGGTCSENTKDETSKKMIKQNSFLKPKLDRPSNAENLTKTASEISTVPEDGEPNTKIKKSKTSTGQTLRTDINSSKSNLDIVNDPKKPRNEPEFTVEIVELSKTTNHEEVQAKTSDEGTIMETIISVRGSASDITVTKVPQGVSQPLEVRDDIKISAVRSTVKNSRRTSKGSDTRRSTEERSHSSGLKQNMNTNMFENKGSGPLQILHEASSGTKKLTNPIHSDVSANINVTKVKDVENTSSSVHLVEKQYIKEEKLLSPLQNLKMSNRLEETINTNTSDYESEKNIREIRNDEGESSKTKVEVAVNRKLKFPEVDCKNSSKLKDLSTLHSPDLIKTDSLLAEDIVTEKSTHTVNDKVTKHQENSSENKNSEMSTLDQHVTPLPKKRGRKKKSEIVVKEEPELRPNVPTIEISASKRSGRKRQVVDYFALAEGMNLDETKLKKPKIEKVSRSIKTENSSNEMSIIDAPPSEDDSLHEVKHIREDTSLDETVNSFLPVDGTIDLEKNNDEAKEVDTPNASTEGLEITLMKIEDTSKQDVGFVKRKISQKNKERPLKPEGQKRKRGRPAGRTSENSLTNIVMDSIFHHINTPANETAEANLEPLNFVNVTLMEYSGEGTSQNEEVQQQGNKKNSVTCAVCQKQLDKTMWQYHKMRYHNNLTWKVGETPLDLSDHKLVVSILSELYKRKKPLFCENCGQSKKSVMGFLSHKSVCQKSMAEVTAMRLQCEFCDKTVMPVSMSAHLKSCKGLHPESNITVIQKPVMLESFSTSKRKAATKAEKLIKVFKEDGTIGSVNENKPKNTRRWFANFDFHPTFFGKKRIQNEITEKGVAKCLFDGCEFESADSLEMANHIWTCSKKPTEGFTCKYCIVTCETEDDILEHMQQTHEKSLNVPLDEGSEEEKEEEIVEEDIPEDTTTNCKVKPAPRANLMHGIKFLLMHRYCSPTIGVAYPPAIEWTLQFCKQNFSILNLFPHWRIDSSWEKLSPEIIIKHLPRLRYSASTARIETKKFVDPLKLDYDWKRYKLFESEMLHNGTSIMFCGGSIFAMAWAPTPFEQADCEQILAVSTNGDVSTEYTLNDVYREPGLIQFWNCGLLANNKIATDKPRLQFCIAHDYGPAWCLEWCPSGCYDIELIEDFDYPQRLGVLAVGCADSHIYIYSIALPDQTDGKIFKPKPILKLVLDSVAEEAASGIEAHVTKISWSKASGHQFLAAGYANGMVAMYDLSTTSVLLKLGLDQNGVEMIMPYRMFTAHYHAITALALYHLNDGRRWLMTGSIDRKIKYWDLENAVVPITNFTKLIVTDGVWLSHWLSTVQTFDDSCGGGLTYTAAHQLRNFESETSSIMHSNSRVSTITGSEWANGFVQGNIVGEVKGFFPHQMFFSMDGDKSYRIKKVILGYARLVEKNLSIQERVEEEQQKLKHVNSKPTQAVDGERMITTNNFNINIASTKSEPATYKEAEERYGLVFCDMRLNSLKEFPTNIESYFKSNRANKLYASRPNIYPMQSINKIALNPNRGSFLHLATGYHVGFVRISCLRFLNDTLRPM